MVSILMQISARTNPSLSVSLRRTDLHQGQHLLGRESSPPSQISHVKRVNVATKKAYYKRNLVTYCEQQTDITDYSCVCTNGTSPPDIAKYINTVPNNVCSANFAQCRIDTPGSQACTTCGTLNPTNIPRSTVSSTVASNTQSATSTAAASASAKGGAGRKTFEGGALVGLLTALGIFL